MTIRQIIKHPDQRLYTTCPPFDFETGKPHLFDLLHTFRDAQGGKALGLSLPQIGVMMAAFIMRLEYEGGPTGKERKETFVCNPVITDFSREKLVMQEGCLSMPWLKVNVERPIGIRGVFRNGVGEMVPFQLDGMQSRVFQHEFEHLIGCTLVNHQHRTKQLLASAADTYQVPG